MIRHITYHIASKIYYLFSTAFLVHMIYTRVERHEFSYINASIISSIYNLSSMMLGLFGNQNDFKDRK